MLATAAQAFGLFIATNIDDIIVLSLFFGRGQGQPGTTRRIRDSTWVSSAFWGLL